MRLLSKMNTELENKLKDSYFVGRLAKEEDLAGTLLDKPVKFIGEYSDDIQFYIKCLSPIPEVISKRFSFQNKILNGNTRSRQNKRILNNEIEIDKLFYGDKLDKVTELLTNKLVVFKLDPSSEYIYVDIVKIENVKPGSSYSLIPGPSLKIGESLEDLEAKLAKKGYPVTLKYYPNIFDPPEFIYFESNIYQVDFNKSMNPTTYSQKDGTDVRFMKIGGDFADMVHARIDGDLFFVETNELVDLRDRINDEGKNLTEHYSYNEPAEERIESEPVQTNENHFQLKGYNKNEFNFLSKFLQKAQNQYRLFYNETDMISFHISVKTNMLTIIGGMSGTGKTQLAKIYGETLGLELGKRLIIIPVSPSYKEPNDILGFLNPSTGIYHESETGLVSLLLEAEKYPERIFMVIFDEMNLSQVEHWFSPFISLLELDEDKRFLTLFSEQDRCINGQYESKIKIHNNVIFVGTVNYDETTTEFSDRLLDRANVIYPRKMSFLDIKKNYSKYEKINEIEPLSIMNASFLKDSANEKDILNLLTEEEASILDELHTLLHSYDRQKGVSFRAVNGIARFISNIPVNEEGNPMISRMEAFDFQVSQRILSKVKGIESFAEPLVGNYGDGSYVEGELVKILSSEKAKQVSDFQTSIEMIKQKAKELTLYGYVQ